MRIVVASCSVTYAGRGDTQLTQAIRAIFIKGDGAISIHSDAGNKPLNYMGKGATHLEHVDETTGLHTWIFDSRKESLHIILHEIISDSDFPLAEIEPGLVRDGTESHLQEWLAENPEALGAGYTLVQREYPTGAGAVDLLVRDGAGNPVAVEVKRVAMLGAVYQAQRYVDALADQAGFENVRGMVAALDVRPKTQILADRRGVQTIILPDTWRGISRSVVN